MRSDFWDHVQTFISEVDGEFSKMVKRGELPDFETAWVDLTVRLRRYEWFVDARPIARKVAVRSIRSHVKGMVEYYRCAEQLLG